MEFLRIGMGRFSFVGFASCIELEKGAQDGVFPHNINNYSLYCSTKLLIAGLGLEK
jgi:hypothetical protein